MSGKKHASGEHHPDAIARTAREELMLMVFRGLSAHQQRELIFETRAMVDANGITHGYLDGKPLRPVSNEDVHAAFKDIPPLGGPPLKSLPNKKRPGRDLGDAMGDFIDE